MMKLQRRRFLRLAACAAVLPAFSGAVHAHTYPSRPVRLVYGFPAGSGGDILARLLGQWLAERLGQPFIVENRLGAATNIATELVVNASADGHTLLVVTSANTTNATTYKKLNFDFIRDIAPVAGMARAPFVMLVNPSLPARTAPEFIAFAKANPGTLNFASSGIGGISHISAELLKMMTGIDMLHVPYRGDAPALSALLGGQVHVYIGTLTAASEHISTGRLRALAVTSAQRWEALPEIPALAEFVPRFEASAWNGIGAPKATPADVIAKLNKEINAALADPKMKARFAALGNTVLAGSSADFGRLIADDTEKWRKVIRAANIKLSWTSAMLRLIAMSAGLLLATGAVAQQTPIERGRYLVDAVMACDGCHTPRPKGQFDMSKRFSGGTRVYESAAYTVRGPNITPDRETGIGSWTAEDLKRLLTTGIRPNGIPVVAQMPYPFYKVLTARDLDAVTAYVRSAAPVRREVPRPVYRGPSQTYDIPGGNKPFTDEMLNDPVKRGYYLANLAHCMECHSRTPEGKQDYVNWWGRGGAPFKGPKGMAKAANITSHKTAGIGAWSNVEIKRTLTHGVGRDGRPLVQPMQRQIYLAKMTDRDLDAIVAWLRTLPPLE